MRETLAQRLRHPRRHDGPRNCKLVEVFLREVGEDRVEAVFDLFEAKPCQGADDHSGRPVRGGQLPAGRMVQLDGVLAEVQSPIAV